MELVQAFRVSQALHVAATLGVADLLGGGASPADDLARATGAHAGALYRLLRAVASVGVLAKDEAGAFALTELGQFLRADHPQSVHGWAVYAGHPTMWGTWQHLRHSVATGEPAFRHLHGVDAWAYREQHPDAGAVFDAAMTRGTLQRRDAVVAGYDFSGARTVVDVAGGHGALLTTVLAANPQARGVLFDQPHVVAGAAPLLREAGVADRCEVVGGSFFEAVPEGRRRLPLEDHPARLGRRPGDGDPAHLPAGHARGGAGGGGMEPGCSRRGTPPDPAKLMRALSHAGDGRPGREHARGRVRRPVHRGGAPPDAGIPTTAGVSLIEGQPA